MMWHARRLAALRRLLAAGDGRRRVLCSVPARPPGLPLQIRGFTTVRDDFVCQVMCFVGVVRLATVFLKLIWFADLAHTYFRNIR